MTGLRVDILLKGTVRKRHTNVEHGIALQKDLLLRHCHLCCLPNTAQLQPEIPAALLVCLCLGLVANSRAGEELISACFDCQRLKEKEIMLQTLITE